jgi:hypothetical protein
VTTRNASDGFELIAERLSEETSGFYPGEHESMEHTCESYQMKKRRDLQSYRLIEAICFVVFLPIALLASLGGWRWHPWSAGPDGYRSPFEEARQMSSRVASLAISV